MDTEIYHRALDDLKELEENTKNQVLDKIEKLEDEGLSIPEVSPWEDNNGEMLFRLKIKDEKADHRAFFDIGDGNSVIYGVFHRYEAYENSVKREIDNRID